jgi:hypothetical protein
MQKSVRLHRQWHWNPSESNRVRRVRVWPRGICRSKRGRHWKRTRSRARSPRLIQSVGQPTHSHRTVMMSPPPMVEFAEAVRARPSNALGQAHKSAHEREHAHFVRGPAARMCVTIPLPIDVAEPLGVSHRLLAVPSRVRDGEPAGANPCQAAGQASGLRNVGRSQLGVQTSSGSNSDYTNNCGTAAAATSRAPSHNGRGSREVAPHAGADQGSQITDGSTFQLIGWPLAGSTALVSH